MGDPGIGTSAGKSGGGVRSGVGDGTSTGADGGVELDVESGATQAGVNNSSTGQLSISSPFDGNGNIACNDDQPTRRVERVEWLIPRADAEVIESIFMAGNVKRFPIVELRHLRRNPNRATMRCAHLSPIDLSMATWMVQRTGLPVTGADSILAMLLILPALLIVLILPALLIVLILSALLVVLILLGLLVFLVLLGLLAMLILLALLILLILLALLVGLGRVALAALFLGLSGRLRGIHDECSFSVGTAACRGHLLQRQKSSRVKCHGIEPTKRREYDIGLP